MRDLSEFWAHYDQATGRVHALDDHLRGVGRLAGSFARKFQSEDWGRVAGLWHDLGKYRGAFQSKIRLADSEQTHLENQGVGKVDHSSAGAVHALERLGSRGCAIALAIAGHHAGLRDFSDWKDRRHPEARRQNLLEDACRAPIPDDILEAAPGDLPGFMGSMPVRATPIAIELWTRMLFSALVDADFLDTEAFYSPQQSELRLGFPALAVLADRLREYLDDLSRSATESTVNLVRRQVLERCRAFAKEKPGVFSLTVPTGGGKTFASLSFAMEHAREHGLDRVVVVAPFLSIIDQTVKEYRRALDETADRPVLIEQHSGVDPDTEDARSRVAAENWEAPLIVTTAVQFFESLFANRSSKCRKLHNLAHAVIVIDEAQTLPGEFLVPILDVLQALVAHYGSTLVLSTATQPVLVERQAGDGRTVRGFTEVREIAGTADEIAATFRALRRVRAERVRTRSWEEIAALVAHEPRALAITHLRQDSHELAQQVKTMRPGDLLFHLSALMCAAHRRAHLDQIRSSLATGENVRVVSTQLVEAGVDIDFPIVFRAMGGLDALIQSAGRCNREGRLGPHGGRLVIYDAPTKPPVGALRTAADYARARFEGDPQLLQRLFDPDTYPQFYEALSYVEDRHGIQELRRQLAFESVATKFRLIDDAWRTTLVVPYGPEPEHLLAELGHTENPRYLRKLSRKLQPYTVEVPKRQAVAWTDAGVLRDVRGMFLALAPLYRHHYSTEFGLVVTKDIPTADPHELIG